MLSLDGPPVQRLDVLEHVLEGDLRRAHLPGGEPIKHKCVVGIGFRLASCSRSGASRWYTESTGNTTVRSVRGTTSNASKGLYADWYQPTCRKFRAPPVKAWRMGTSIFQ